MAEFIKARLKYFFLSFFSDKTAKDAPKFGFFWVILALLLSFLFLLFGYYGASVAPFATHYDNAKQYMEFIDNAFDNVTFAIKNKLAESDKIINTYVNPEDGNDFIKNGYNLIVDTRPSDMLIEFKQIAKKGDGIISYEEYLALGDGEKEGYTLEIQYTDTELVIRSADVEKYERFFETSTEESVKKDFEALDKNATDYGRQLYYAYVKHYYVSVGSIFQGSVAPVLRDYYYRKYITNGNAMYFYVFDDMCAGSFRTDGDIPVVFGGYFSKCADGDVGDVHAFVKRVYYDTAGLTLTTYFISMISQLPTLVFVPIFLGLIMWGTGKLIKNGWVKTFGGCYKTVNSFVWISSLLTALAVLIGGYLTTARLMYMLIPVLFGGILLVRTAVFCIVSAVRNRKEAPATVGQENKDDIFGGKL